MDDLPSVDPSDSAMEHVTTGSNEKRPVHARQTSFATAPRDSEQKFGRNRSFGQTSDDKNQFESSNESLKKPPSLRIPDPSFVAEPVPHDKFFNHVSPKQVQL